MTVPFCNTTVSILRGNAADDFADDVDNATVAASGIPAPIVEQPPKSETRRVDGQPRTVRGYACRLPGYVDLRDDDRIKDDITGDIYVIDSMRKPKNNLTGATWVLTLMRAT